MKGVAKAHDTIIRAAIDALAELGLARLTTAVVSRRAGVSTALLHYHFDTKQQLIVAVAQEVARQRLERRRQAWETGSGGLARLDAVWQVLVTEHAAALDRVVAALRDEGRHEAAVAAPLVATAREELRLLRAHLPALLGELGGSIVLRPEEAVALGATVLDGLEARLAAGADAAELRATYDAFWLVLLAARPAARP